MALMTTALFWVASVFLALFGIAAMTDSIISGSLIVLAAALCCPPLWRMFHERTGFEHRKASVVGVAFLGILVGAHMHAQSPEGRAEAAKRKAEADREAALEEQKEKEAAKQADEKAKAEAKLAETKQAEEAKLEAEKKASGAHCFSAWDGSLPILKEAVKTVLRNPDSFDHASTTYRKKSENIVVTMTYRAQNGFGGMNIEQVVADVEPVTCTVLKVREG